MSVVAFVPRVHVKGFAGRPFCGTGVRKFVPHTTEDLAQVTCLKCLDKVSKLERKDTSMTAFTETEDTVERTPDGVPIPTKPDQALGWLVDVPFTDGNTYQGEVRGTTYNELKVLFPDQCPRDCCLVKVKMGQATFVGMAPCELCDSGVAAVLCTCDDPLPPEGQAGEVEPPKEEAKK